MFRLASLLYTIIGSSLAGTMVVIALVAGFDDYRGIIAAAAFGFLAALPAAWIIAKRIY